MFTCRQPPSHYFEQLDTYLHSGRDLDLELEARGSGQLEKKQKSSSSRREEGGLLPPLLALAPQVVLTLNISIESNVLRSDRHRQPMH